MKKLTQLQTPCDRDQRAPSMSIKIQKSSRYKGPYSLIVAAIPMVSMHVRGNADRALLAGDPIKWIT